MTIIFIRTLFFYVVLIIIMRLMGKRQIGELQMNEFVTAFLISEMAALPMTESDIPPLAGLIPLITIACLEILVSFICKKSPFIRKIVDGEPIILINRGIICEKALIKSRITLDEVFAQIRNEGYNNIGDVWYVILEQTGKMSILPKAGASPFTKSDSGISYSEAGMSHPVVIDGKASKCFMESAGITPRDISNAARKAQIPEAELLYMTFDDTGAVGAVRREKS